MGDEMAAGRIAALWRYPVKSMLGETREDVRIEARGVVGDRQWAVRTAEGKLGSGKTTRRFGRVDGLFGFRAWYDGATPCIALPSGATIRGDAPDVDAVLSRAAGQPLSFVREESVSHLDSSPVHIVTTASLRWLVGCAGEEAGDARRFRPNIVLEIPGSGRIEDDWIGRRLRMGEVALRITAKTVRCVMTTFAQDELADDPNVLGALARENDACLGVYAEVLQGGPIRVGDLALVDRP